MNRSGRIQQGYRKNDVANWELLILSVVDFVIQKP